MIYYEDGTEYGSDFEVNDTLAPHSKLDCGVIGGTNDV